MPLGFLGHQALAFCLFLRGDAVQLLLDEAAAFGDLGMEIGQGAAHLGRVGGVGIGVMRRRDMRQRPQRQAEADGAVTGHQEQLAAPGFPQLRLPFRRLALPALDRQHIARGLVQPTVEDAGIAGAVLGVLQLGVLGRDVGGKVRFFQDPFRRILEGRLGIVRVEAKRLCEAAHELTGLFGGGLAVIGFAGNQVGVLPDRLLVVAPVKREGPARQAFARIPFALAVMQEPAGRETLLKPADQRVGQPAFLRADGIGVPFAGLEIVDRDEGRLAAHGQAHIALFQPVVDMAAKRVQPVPGLVREGLGDPGVFGHPLDLHVKFEIDLGRARGGEAPGNRRGILVMRRGGQRDMAFAGHQSRGRVEADPAGARQVDLAPGMEVGEVVIGARGAIQRLEIRFQLDQVARDKARGKAQVAQQLHQQP